MIKERKTLRKIIEENPKWVDIFYKAVTFTAVVVSVALILNIAITERRNPSSDSGDNLSANPTPSPMTDNTSDPDSTEQNTANNPSPEITGGSKKDTSLTLSFTDREASELIAFSLADRLPLEQVSVSFASPDLVEISGRVKKDKIGALVEKENLPLAEAALLLAPDELDGKMIFHLTFDSEGNLTALPEKVAVGKVDITGFIPESLIRSAGEAMRSMLPEDMTLQALSIDNGSVTFTLTKISE